MQRIYTHGMKQPQGNVAGRQLAEPGADMIVTSKKDAL
jgi:hypothetical protein